jgi:hypothetical protein
MGINGSQTFNHVYYRVPLPAGMEEPAGQRPEDAGQLSIINVRAAVCTHPLYCLCALAERLPVLLHGRQVTRHSQLYTGHVRIAKWQSLLLVCAGHLWCLPPQCTHGLHGRDWRRQGEPDAPAHSCCTSTRTE